ncbi:Actin-depolymerizing factor 6 [Striga hermonthica]|uniref:Actin-depolymerizing factor 6 n=1 Tax=Striga hermonthica TaxID=68872 RepID=A0A9N7MXM1_STRHE|nr:Actin-depolymerizing factor 6 [Striga hermonthica]
MSFRCGGTNASSGMGVADHSKSTYMELQRKKVHRYVIFKIDEKKKEVVVEKTGGPAESYEDFMASLPESPHASLEFVQRCFTPHPRECLGESLWAYTTRSKQLTQPRWTLTSSENVLIESPVVAQAPFVLMMLPDGKCL